eukprot:1242630-Amphidinium_carterae.1
MQGCDNLERRGRCQSSPRLVPSMDKNKMKEEPLTVERHLGEAAETSKKKKKKKSVEPPAAPAAPAKPAKEEEDEEEEEVVPPPKKAKKEVSSPLKCHPL